MRLCHIYMANLLNITIDRIKVSEKEKKAISYSYKKFIEEMQTKTLN